MAMIAEQISRRTIVMPVRIRPNHKVLYNAERLSNKPEKARKYPVILASIRRP
jgi:hypothetical protein